MPILFLESKTLSYPIDSSQRIALLDVLQQKALTPLIRSARQYCFEQLAVSTENIAVLESSMASWMESNGAEPYIHGDAFCFPDHVFFLMFNEKTQDSQQIRAGIVYDTSTSE